MIYLDNASTTKIDPRVLEAMMPYLTDEYGNAGTLYGLGRKSAEAISKAREQVAELIHAKAEQIIFTSGGSEANNLVFAGTKDYLRSIGKTHIITSQIEHDSILNAVKNMCKPQYIVGDSCTKSDFDATFVPPVGNYGVISPSMVIDTIDKFPNTGIVSIMHTNNETGITNMVEQIGCACSKRGVLFHTDCVQAASSCELNVDNIYCDFMSISSHKIHGAKGIGALFVRDKSVMSPIIFGGKSQEFGLRGGTENVAGIVGFGESCRILHENIYEDQKYMRELTKLLNEGIIYNLKQYGLEHIAHLNGCGSYDGNTHSHIKTINVRFDNVDGETLLLMLDSRGVCVSAGSACRSHESEPSQVLLAMGIDAEDARNSIRISVSRMNSIDDVKNASKIIADCVNVLYSQS